MIPVLNRINGLASSIKNNGHSPVINNLFKNENNSTLLSEKSTFKVDLNGNNGTMVSFKIHKPNEDNKSDCNGALIPYSAQTIQSIPDKSRLFEINIDFNSKNKLTNAKEETELTTSSAKDISQNSGIIEKHGRNGFILDENQKIFHKNAQKSIQSNNSASGVQKTIVSSNNSRRGKIPSFPLHERICRRFQLKTINDSEEYKTFGEDSEFTMEYANLCDEEPAINNDLKFCLESNEKTDLDSPDKRNGNSSSCKIYKPWLMLDTNNEDVIEEDDHQECNEKEMDCRYLTPDYKPTLKRQGPEQKRREKQVQNSIKQLIIPHNNTYSSFETKVVDGLRYAVAAKSNTEKKKDNRVANHDNRMHRNDDSSNGMSSEYFGDNVETEISFNNKNVHQIGHYLPNKYDSYNGIDEVYNVSENQFGDSNEVNAFQKEPKQLNETDLRNSTNKVEGRRYVDQVFETIEHPKKQSKDYVPEPKNGLNGIIKNRGI